MNVNLINPGHTESDTRQIIYSLLQATGLSLLLAGPTPVERTLSEALRVSPAFGNSNYFGRGLMEFNHDQKTRWLAIENTQGSAVIVFGSPDSDPMFLVEHVVDPFTSAHAPFTSQQVMRGQAEPEIVEFLRDFDVVALTEFGPFNQIPTGSLGVPMPISLRRAASSWRRMGENLYSKHLEEFGADAYLGMVTTVPEILTPIDETGQVPAWAAELANTGTYRLDHADNLVSVAAPVSGVRDAQELSTRAWILLRDVNSAYESSLT